MQHAFLKELRGNWTHRTRFNDGDGKSKVNEFESLHIYYQAALCSPLRMFQFGEQTSIQSSLLSTTSNWRAWPWPARTGRKRAVCGMQRSPPNAGLGRKQAPPQSPSWATEHGELGLPFNKRTVGSICQCPSRSRINNSSRPFTLPPATLHSQSKGTRATDDTKLVSSFGASPSKTIWTYPVSPTAVLDEENTVIINNMCPDSMN